MLYCSTGVNCCIVFRREIVCSKSQFSRAATTETYSLLEVFMAASYASSTFVTAQLVLPHQYDSIYFALIKYKIFYLFI